jgi:hypothetical protein
MNPIVVVYYSRTGVTRHVAERLASILKADLEEIRETVDRSGLIGYIKAGRDAIRRKEAILITRHSAEGRKIIVLGMPVWGFNPPPAIRAYVKETLSEGARICGFATMNGSGAEKTLDKVAGLLPGGLASRLCLKRPKAGDAALETRLREWAAEIKELSV